MTKPKLPVTYEGVALDRFPWERQPGESDKAYVAFRTYRDQEPPRRLADVCVSLSRSMTLIARWSAKHKWLDRAAHYDTNVERTRAAGTAEARREMNDRHAMLAKAMSAKVAKRIQDLSPDELSPGELGRWMQTISLVERLALGEATERTERTGDAAGEGNTFVQVNASIDAGAPDPARIAEVVQRLQDRGVWPTSTDAESIIEVAALPADPVPLPAEEVDPEPVEGVS
jgi:hypothetical protein